MHSVFLSILLGFSFYSVALFAECAPVEVAVIDSGADSRHPDLAPHLLQGKDFGDKDDDPMDSELLLGHGTAVSGIVLGLGGNTLSGVASVSCPIKVRPYKIQKSECSDEDYAENGCIVYTPSNRAPLRAFDEALKQPNVKVINNSWGLLDPHLAQQLIYRLETAKKKGVFVVVAAGNERMDLDWLTNEAARLKPVRLCKNKKACPLGKYSGAALRKALNRLYPNLILVANADPNNSVWQTYSNYGKSSVHVAALGERVNSTSLGRGYDSENYGTSFSAPKVSRALALLIARNPSKTYLQILQDLKSLVRPDPVLKDQTIWGGYLP